MRAWRRVVERVAGPAFEAVARRLERTVSPGEHVEVAREGSLAPRPESIPPDGSRGLERGRFTLALLEAAFAHRDLRYLNAGLKLDDWQLAYLGSREHSRLARRHPEVARQLELQYAAAIDLQERGIRELLPGPRSDEAAA